LTVRHFIVRPIIIMWWNSRLNLLTECLECAHFPFWLWSTWRLTVEEKASLFFLPCFNNSINISLSCCPRKYLWLFLTCLQLRQISDSLNQFRLFLVIVKVSCFSYKLCLMESMQPFLYPIILNLIKKSLYLLIPLLS
jgi:hypothetical protein